MASSRRNLNVEALRLAAIAAIALFHSFQTLFAQAASAAQAGAVAGDFALGGMVADPAQLVASTPWALGLLGFINLMGAFGNNVFYAISGCFLIPSAARRSRESGYASDQLRRTARRALVLLATVVFYACAALAVNAWVVPVAGVGLDDFGWLVGGLEFIWVYLVLVIATPMMGWVWERCPHRTALVVALGAVVMGVNAYIAFVSPGGEVRSLLEWRKLMSAVTYVVAYLAGAVVAQTCEAANAVERDGARRVRRAFALAFAASLGASLVIEGGLAVLGAGDFMVATSFKSTSASLVRPGRERPRLCSLGAPAHGVRAGRRARRPSGAGDRCVLYHPVDVRRPLAPLGRAGDLLRDGPLRRCPRLRVRGAHHRPPDYRPRVHRSRASVGRVCAPSSLPVVAPGIGTPIGHRGSDKRGAARGFRARGRRFKIFQIVSEHAI